MRVKYVIIKKGEEQYEAHRKGYLGWFFNPAKSKPIFWASTPEKAEAMLRHTVSVTFNKPEIVKEIKL
jgi:hypothetical protein